jgi:hypothetical protein
MKVAAPNHYSAHSAANCSNERSLLSIVIRHNGLIVDILLDMSTSALRMT